MFGSYGGCTSLYTQDPSSPERLPFWKSGSRYRWGPQGLDYITCKALVSHGQLYFKWAHTRWVWLHLRDCACRGGLSCSDWAQGEHILFSISLLSFINLRVHCLRQKQAFRTKQHKRVISFPLNSITTEKVCSSLVCLEQSSSPRGKHSYGTRRCDLRSKWFIRL